MVGLGSLSGGGVLIAGGGAGCTDCFRGEAESVGGSLLAILGIDSIPNPDSRPAATHFNRGEGIYPRWAAKLPQIQQMRLVRQTAIIPFRVFQRWHKAKQ